MINTFLAALVALFFWGKSTKDVEEKTQLASITRTIIYGVLFIAVLVFYLKTYQVATLNNSVHILPIKYGTDSLGNNVDTIKFIRIANKFSPGITENGDEKKISLFSDEIESVEYSSVSVFQVWHNEKKYQNKVSEGFKEFQRKMLPYFEELYYLGKDIKNFNHIYECTYICPTMPSLIPLFPTIKQELDTCVGGIRYISERADFKSYDLDNFNVKKRINNVDGSVTEVAGNEKAYHESYITSYSLVNTAATDSANHFYYSTYRNIHNRLGFFTAADISQYTQVIDVQSESYVEKLSILFDLPIEINPFDSCMRVTSKSITITGDMLKKDIVDSGGVELHIKFPTLANLQLIRSLILTTLVTALFSLFFLNLFYCIRKAFIGFRENHISQISESKVKSFKLTMKIILYAFTILVSYLLWRIIYDNPFHIEQDYYLWLIDNYIYVILGCIVVISVIVYYIFRKAYTKEKK